MRCSHCIQEAEYKCRSQQAYMCRAHLQIYLETLENPEYEVLISLEQSRFQKVRLETSLRIQKIQGAEKMIADTTKSLIKTIQRAYKEAIRRLDSLKKKYFEIQEHNRYSTSEMPMIENIETMELKVNTLEEDQILNQIQGFYEGELVNYVRRGNSYIEMSLEQRIDFYHPIVLYKVEDLISCQKYGKELLLSNDGKYLFFCKLHLGI